MIFNLFSNSPLVDGLERIRISSVEPNVLSNELLELAASHGNICRHFHVPLQSGDDDVLRRMRRRYRTVDYAELVDRIRRALPDCGIGADVIVGFRAKPRKTSNGHTSFCGIWISATCTCSRIPSVPTRRRPQ